MTLYRINKNIPLFLYLMLHLFISFCFRLCFLFQLFYKFFFDEGEYMGCCMKRLAQC